MIPFHEKHAVKYYENEMNEDDDLFWPIILNLGMGSENPPGVMPTTKGGFGDPTGRRPVEFSFPGFSIIGHNKSPLFISFFCNI